MTTKYSIEDQLLLACMRLNLPSEQSADFSDLASNRHISWERVIEKAEWYRASGLLFHHARQLGEDHEPPPWVMGELKRIHDENTTRNMIFRLELTKVLKSLRQAGIPVIVLKGAALLEVVYKNPSLRPMSDLDLLVPEEYADIAQNMILEFGYHEVGSLEDQEITRRDHRHLPTLSDRNGLVVFEVHSHIVSRDSPLRFDISEFWDQAIDVKIAGVEVKVLKPEHMLIHLAAHFFLDRRFRSLFALGQLCDISETVRKYSSEIEWAEFGKQISRYRLDAVVYTAFYLSHRLLSAPIPEAFLTELAPINFQYEFADELVKRRILDTRPLLVTSLVAPQNQYTLLNLVRNVIRRVIPGKRYLTSRYGTRNTSTTSGLYRRRFTDAFSQLSKYARNPYEIWQQMRVDRWVHSIQNEMLSFDSIVNRRFDLPDTQRNRMDGRYQERAN